LTQTVPIKEEAGALTATAPPLSEPLARRTMRLSVIEGSLGMFFVNKTSGSVLTGCALHLGATPGLVASVPLLGQAFRPLAAWLVSRSGRCEGVAVGTALIGCGLWLLAAALPLLPGPAHVKGALLVALVALSGLFIAANRALWTAWMGDVVSWEVVPRWPRGRYFRLRTGVLGVVGTVASLTAGVWLDPTLAPVSFQVVLLAAASASSIESADSVFMTALT
jgi:hypothetical protein